MQWITWNFLKKRTVSTVYCNLHEKVHFYHLSINECAWNLSSNETKAGGIDQFLMSFPFWSVSWGFQTSASFGGSFLWCVM